MMMMMGMGMGMRIAYGSKTLSSFSIAGGIGMGVLETWLLSTMFHGVFDWGLEWLWVLHRQGFRMFQAGFFWVKTSTIILTKTMAERGKFRDIDVRTACSMSLQLLRKFEYRGIRHVCSRFQRWSLGEVMTSWVEQSCRGFGILTCFDFAILRWRFRTKFIVAQFVGGFPPLFFTQFQVSTQSFFSESDSANLGADVTAVPEPYCKELGIKLEQTATKLQFIAIFGNMNMVGFIWISWWVPWVSWGMVGSPTGYSTLEGFIMIRWLWLLHFSASFCWSMQWQPHQAS